MNPTPPITAPEGEVPPRRFTHKGQRDMAWTSAYSALTESDDPADFDEYVSAQLLSAEKQLGLRAVEEAIALVNEVQQLLASYTTNSSEMLSGVRAAFNLNARYLSKNFEAQTRYLAEQSRAAKEPS